MIQGKIKMRAKVWLYPGMAGWHFITLPKTRGQEIKELFGNKKIRGFGSIPVMVTIGKTSWKTSIFPDKKSGSYVLPIKTEIRKKENISIGDNITFQIEIKI